MDAAPQRGWTPEELFRAMTAGFTPPEAGSTASGAAPGPAGLGLEALGEVSGAFLASGLRYWSRLGEMWIRAWPVLLRAATRAPAGAGADAEAAALADDVRAVLRELADLPCQESRRLQAELDRITAAGAIPAPDPDAPYWRRWDAKA